MLSIKKIKKKYPTLVDVLKGLMSKEIEGYQLYIPEDDMYAIFLVPLTFYDDNCEDFDEYIEENGIEFPCSLKYIEEFDLLDDFLQAMDIPYI
jgi:hypothetical protein